MIVWREFTGHTEPALLHDIVSLRELVWRANGLTALEALRLDALDLSAHHVVAFAGDTLVASSQVSLHRALCTLRDAAHYAPVLREGSFPAAVLNRLVVRPSHSGRRLAAAMDARRMDVATRWGVRTALTEVRGARVTAMKALGFVALGISPDLRYPGTWFIMQKAMTPLRDQP